MTMNYDAYSLGNRGNALPLYNNYLTFATQNYSTNGKNWFKAADFSLQRNATNVKNLYNRRINRFFLTAIVYDGDASIMQAFGLLNISAWIPDDVEQMIHTNISLKSLLDDNNLSISDQLESRIYSKKVVNEDTDEYNVQIWFNAKQFFSKVTLHPLQCEFLRTPYNPHSLLDNYASNKYERLTELFKNMGSTNGVSESELDTSMQGYSYVTTDPAPDPDSDTFYTTTDQYKIGDNIKYVNIAYKDSGVNTLSTIIPDKQNAGGRIIYLCNWNKVVLKNGGRVQDWATLHNAIICPGGKDYVMEDSQLLPLMRYSGNWIPLTTGSTQ